MSFYPRCVEHLRKQFNRRTEILNVKAMIPPEETSWDPLMTYDLQRRISIPQLAWSHHRLAEATMR